MNRILKDMIQGQIGTGLCIHRKRLCSFISITVFRRETRGMGDKREELKRHRLIQQREDSSATGHSV